MEVLGIDGGIILKCILKNRMQVWNGLVWLTKEVVTGCHEHGNEPLNFKEVRNPLTSRKGGTFSRKTLSM